MAYCHNIVVVFSRSPDPLICSSCKSQSTSTFRVVANDEILKQ